MIDNTIINGLEPEVKEMIAGYFRDQNVVGLIQSQIELEGQRLLLGAMTQDKETLVADILAYRNRVAFLEGMLELGKIG